MSWALAIASGALLVLVFPRWNLWFLAPVALTPLLVAAARQDSWKRRLQLGQLSGFVFWAGLCYWVQFVLANHGGLEGPLGWFSFALFAFLKALHTGAFALLCGPLMRTPYAIPAVAALWTGLERTHGELGFTWLLLGNAGIDMGLPMRLAPYTGVFGLSFVFAMLNVAVALVILRRPRIHLAPLAALPLLWLLPELPQNNKATENVAVLQTNVPQSARWDDASLARLIQRTVVATVGNAIDPAQTPPRFVLWPESPAPFYFYTDPQFESAARQLARTVRAPFLFGSVSFTGDTQPLNSALMLSPSGEPVARYDKMYLVPFGEFVPPVFFWVNRITQEAGDFVPGRQLKIMPVDGHGVGAFICYESAFPELVRRFADQGGEVLVNMTNDGYFGRTAAREQHLLLARMRAAENRRWLVRPTNDGYTAAIDPAGRIREQMIPYEAVAGRLHFSWIREKTLYTRFGDWFAWLCLVAGLVAAVRGLIPAVAMLVIAVTPVRAADRTSYQDPVTGNTVFELTATGTSSNLYYHASNFTADNRYVILSHDPGTGAQIYRSDATTGELTAITDEPGVAAAGATPHPDQPRILYYVRSGGEVVEIDIMDRKRRVLGKVPGAGGQPSLSHDRKSLTLSRKLDAANWEIGLMDIATGAWRPVVRQGFQIGHVQHHPTRPLIFYVWETGGYAPQRSWLVNDDGSGNRPFYYRTDRTQWFTPLKEWLTHESWIPQTGQMTMIMDKVGIVVVDPDGANRMLIRGDWWHCTARPDGKYLVADDFDGRVWLIEAATGNTRLLATGIRRDKATHGHPSFDRQGRYVIFNSSRSGRQTVAMVAIP